MSDLQVSIGVGEIVGVIVSVAGSYIAWSAKRLLNQFEKNINSITERCEEHETRLDQHEHCLLKVCVHHEHNHGQKVDCKL